MSVKPPAGRRVSLVLCALLAVPVLTLLLVLAGSVVPAQTASADGGRCLTFGPLPGLDTEQAQNARTVAAAAQARAGGRAVVIALVIGLTESGLRRLGNPNDPSAAGLASQGVGHDHDSIGLFQQRPSWGTAQQRLDAVASTNLLLDRVTTIPEWQTADPWRIAQDVQISAYDGAPRPANNFSADYGGNYRSELPQADALASLIGHDALVSGCRGDGGAGLGAAPAGLTGGHGLPTGFVLQPSTAAERIAVGAALGQRGKPYVFGAAGPVSFDCSGLTQWAWAQAGVTLPHYTGAQLDAGVPTDAAHLTAGDLVLTPGSDGTLADPGHVGMYIGDGLVVEAPQTGDVVKVVTYDSFVSGGLSGLRHIG